MLFVSFLPKSAQVVIYRIISIVFLIPTVALFSDGYYVAGFVAALASGAIMAASFVVAKWARDEKEAERLKAQAHAALSAQSLYPPGYPAAYPQAYPPGYAPPSAPPPYAPYTPGQSFPPLPPMPNMPNMPTGQSWSSVPLPPPPNVPPPGAAQQTPGVRLPERSSASSSSQAWIAPALTLVGMALFVALGVAILGYMAKRSAGDTAVLESAQIGNRGVSSPQPLSIPEHRAEKRVLALYYPWYRTLQHSHHWEHQSGVNAARRHIASHTHYPAQGPYDSMDAAVLDRHLKEAEQAGIDTLVCSWWGRKDATDSALRLLLQRAAGTQIKICVLWEQPPGQAGTDALGSELTYLLETFGKQPAYLRVGDKPVVFVFNRVVRSVDEDGWGYVRQAAALHVPPGAFLLSDGPQRGDLVAWSGYFLLGAAAPLIDGQSPAVCANVQNREYFQVSQASREAHRLSVFTVFPGYDDRKPNAALHIAARTFLDRQDGQLYETLWKQAITDDPDWILVNSFNQWHAGTEIEPSVEMGDKYLRLTRQYAAQFRK